MSLHTLYDVLSMFACVFLASTWGGIIQERLERHH